MRTIRDESEYVVGFENVRVLRCTPKAMLVDIDGDEHWIPHSQVHDNSEVYMDEHMAVQGSPGKLVVTLWIAREKGLVDS